MDRFEAIDEPALRRLVETFYGRAREDALLGPVFGRAVHDWPAHFDLLTDFWSSVLLGTGRFHGRPLPKHAAAGVTSDLFPRWLELWDEAVDSLFAPGPAEVIKAKAAHIGQSMSAALWLSSQAAQGVTPESARRSSGA